MSTQPGTIRDKTIETSISIIQKLLAQYHPRNFAVRLWDGTTWNAEPGQPTRFTMEIKHPGALRTMFWPPNEVSMAEAYIYDDFDIEGEIEPAFEMANHLFRLRLSAGERLTLGMQFLSLPSDRRARSGRQAAHLRGRRYTKERDRQAVTYHYDTSNDFFALWLDTRMVYSCAYFHSPNDDLDAAQERKLDYICRKLRLRRGERLLDIGCGWGSFAIYAARNYGVSVHGITLSEPQALFAHERIRQEGLTDLCRVDVGDYRDLKEFERYDKLVSIGMFEHVGEPILLEYFQHAWRLLRPGGVFLNHGVAHRFDQHARHGPTFTDSYVFPDSDPVPIHISLRAAERSGFEVRDVEGLREHYALTLRHWRRRLEAHHDDARRIIDETTYRVWRLYMAGAAYGFDTGRNNVYQTLLIKPDSGKSGLPFTRADWYQ